MVSLKDFTIINKLGEGAYSQVYKVKRNSDQHTYALKKVSLDPLSQKERENALNEVRILASIQHPNVVGYKEAFIEEERFLCIIMDYADDGDLYQKIVEHQKNKTNFEEESIWKIFIQMVKGLKSLHSLKILHRDMKSANIFLNKDGTTQLGDLNVSKVAKKGLLYTQTGTPYYASPEVWKDQPYDSKSDVWSLGCVLYEIATLQPPFRAQDMDGLYKKVLKGQYPRIPAHYSEDLNKMIKKLICVNPMQRMNCDQILSSELVNRWSRKLGMIENMNSQANLSVSDQDDGLGGNLGLLNTIKLPKNLKLLSDRLPKSKYNNIEKEQKKQLSEVQSTQSLSNLEESTNNGNGGGTQIRTGGRKSKIADTSALSKRSALSEERGTQLKRNASENLKPKRIKPKQPQELMIGGEKLRDKNSHDYLETIRENEQLLAKMTKQRKYKQPPTENANYDEESFDSYMNSDEKDISNGSQNKILYNKYELGLVKKSSSKSKQRIEKPLQLPDSIDIIGTSISQNYSVKKSKNVSLHQDILMNNAIAASLPNKYKKRIPLLLPKPQDRLPSLERGKNSSEMTMKLPDIKNQKMSRESTALHDISNLAEKQISLREKLVHLYGVKQSKAYKFNRNYTQEQPHYYVKPLKPPLQSEGIARVRKPNIAPSLASLGIQPSNNGSQSYERSLPQMRPQWWG